MSNTFLAGLDWLADRLYGPGDACGVKPCGDFDYLNAAHRAKCSECRRFAKWLKEGG